MTAPLGGASPVLQVRDSRLRWDGDTDSSGSMSLGDVTLSGCSLVTATVLTRPLARPSCWPGRLVGPRVVFNDALRARQDAHAAGEKISDTQVRAQGRDP